MSESQKSENNALTANSVTSVNAQEGIARTRIMVFAVGNSYYGLPIADVREVTHLKGISPLPQVPAHVLGLANVRGEVYAVVDMAKVTKNHSLQGDDFLIVLKDDENQAALKINSLPQTLSIEENLFDRSSDTLSQLKRENLYTEALIKTDNRLIMLIDAVKMIRLSRSGD